MNASAIFEILIRQNDNCETRGRMTNYAILIGVYGGHFQYNILSYSSLFIILISKHSTWFIRDILANTPVINNKPRSFDINLVLKESKEACIEQAIVCLFPYTCILSDNSDILINRIAELYTTILNTFRKSLPGVERNKNFTTQSLVSFRIPQAYCYWYDNCFGMETNLTHTAEIIRTRAFSHMKKKAIAMWGEESVANYILRPNICNPPVFICHASGECNVYMFQSFYNELQKGFDYIMEHINFEYWILDSSFFDFNFPQALYNKTQKCSVIFLYGDTTGRFAVYQKEYKTWFPKFLLKYFSNFEFWIQNFADLFMVNSTVNNFCPVRYPSSCLSLSFNNKFLDEPIEDAMKMPKFRDNYVLVPPEIVFLPPVNQRPRSVRSLPIDTPTIQINQQNMNFTANIAVPNHDEKNLQLLRPNDEIEYNIFNKITSVVTIENLFKVVALLSVVALAVYFIGKRKVTKSNSGRVEFQHN